MHKLAALVLLFCLSFSGLFAARKTKPSTKQSAKNRQALTSARKTTPSKRARSTVRKRGRKPPRQTWRTRQLAPAPDRYRQIQQALIDRGFLKGEATGDWGPDSIAALKDFQQAQNLEPTGRIDSLSLIALGLGPRRTASAPTATPDAQ